MTQDSILLRSFVESREICSDGFLQGTGFLASGAFLDRPIDLGVGQIGKPKVAGGVS